MAFRARDCTTKVPQTGSRTMAAPGLGTRLPRPDRRVPVAPSTIPSKRRQIDRSTKSARTKNSRNRTSMTCRSVCARRCRLARAAESRMGGLHRVERTLGGLSFRTVRCELHDALPGLVGGAQILFGEREHDPLIQHRLGMLGIDLQRALKLRERLVRLILVVVADTQVGTHVGIGRIERDRLFVPLDGIVVSLGVEVEVAELRTRS